jgi:uncharacterized repeat protein (TIGR01451 family)
MRRRIVALVVLSLVYTTVCSGASVHKTAPDEMLIRLTFDISEFTFETIGGYDYVRGEGAVYLSEQGLPGLPMRPYSIVIPWDTRVADIEVRTISEARLEGSFDIVPTQPPAVLGQGQAAWIDGRADVYSANELHPQELVAGLHQGFMGDSRLAGFNISPFRWNPVTKRLVLCEELEVRISLERVTVRRPFRRRADDTSVFSNVVERTVLNPDDVSTYLPGGGRRLLGQSMLEEGYYEYVIITVDSLVTYYDPLLSWKIEKGVPAKCVTREWIEANYTGEDTQAQIRNFIVDAYETWGVVWVLLGADTKIIPSRTVFAMDCEMGGVAGNKIRCDLYFSDLDGNWNADGVKPYGGVTDSVDMYADVFVGRAPAENITETIVFVDKVLTYEKNPPAGYALDMLMLGEIMWTSPYTDGGIGLDRIDDDFIPPRFDPITKLYESLGNESAETVLAAMSGGQNFVIHDGHCNEFCMGAGDGYVYYWDADTLSNGSRAMIINSIGCWPAAIDQDCIAEHFVNNPNGGCVAFIGNSRYGWGSPGNPGFGYSDKFQYEFTRSVFASETLHLGSALAESKAVFVNFAGDENVYRWNEYQLNLLGDPEMPAWTDEPAGLVVAAPESIMASGDVVTVVVEDVAGAVEGAKVCLMNDDDVYATGLTDVSGVVTLSVLTASPDSMLLTVTAYNHIPHQQMIDVVNQGKLLAWTVFAVGDADDAKANPGETVDLEVTVKNFGTQTATGVSGILMDSSGLCTLTDSTSGYGDIGPGSEAVGDGFTVTFDNSLVNGDVIVFDLVLTDGSADQWTCRLPIAIATPVLYVASYGIDDRLGGDGDWMVEPGETVLVTVEIANDGLTYTDAGANMTSLDVRLSAEDSVSSVGQIGSGSTGYSLHKVFVSGVCPGKHIGMLEIGLTGTGGYAVTDTVYFSVGDLCYSDDCEWGEGSWVHTGAPDLWHLSSYRSHSDSVSWYYGYETTHSYPNNAVGGVVSEDFIAGEHNRLSFWFWYDFTTYGTDGLYVIVHRNGVPDTLDFIGSGGALDQPGSGALNIVSDWVKWESPLDDLAPGDTVTLEFGFISDNTDYAEGIYVDDISYTSRTPVLTGIEDTEVEVRNLAFSAFPNPARDRVVISFANRLDRVDVDIYTVEGRLVARLFKPAGAQAVSWDLCDRLGRKVAPGIYLANVRTHARSQSGKIVIVK